MYTRRKSRVGVVTSDKMQKTVIVAVESHKRHPLYNKTIRRTTRYKVHDANDLAKLGDIVRIIESRPISREKRWRLAEVVTRREVAEIAPRDIDASMFGINRPHTESAAATAEAAREAPPAPEVETVAEAPAVEEVAAPAAEAGEAPAEEQAPPAQSEGEPETVAEQEEEQTKE
jgi:small subunit ribosomal protein S17